MGKGNNDMEHTYEDILGNAGENKWTVQRGATSLQRDTTHFTIKGTFNQNSAKIGLHNVWVFKLPYSSSSY